MCVAGVHTHWTGINLAFIELRALKVVEVWDDKLVPIRVKRGLKLEYRWDKVSQSEQLSYDGVTSTHKLEDSLPTQVVLREDVQCSHYPNWH